MMGYRRLLLPTLLIVFTMVGMSPRMANEDKPQRGDWDFKLEKVWEIGSAGDTVLGRPEGILASDDGILYLNDEANRRDYIMGISSSLLQRGARGPERSSVTDGSSLPVTTSSFLIWVAFTISPKKVNISGRLKSIVNPMLSSTSTD
jgi:hypothetical protein